MTQPDSRLVVVAMATIVASALAVDPGGWFSFGPLRWGLMSTLLAVMAALLLRARRLQIHRYSAWGWLAFVAWAGVTATLGLDPVHAWIGTPDRRLGVLSVMLFGVAYFAGQTLAAPDAVVRLTRAAVVALLGIALYTGLETLGFAPVDVTTSTARPGGPFGSAAYLGAACALLVPISFGGAVDGLGHRRWAVLAWAAAAGGSFAALASQTRAGWVGLIAAGLVSLPATGAFLKRRWPIIGAGFAALAIVVVVTPLAGRISGAFDFDDGTARGRIDEWQAGSAVAVNHPLTGVGLEGYRIAFAEGADADYEQRYGRIVAPDRTHNGPLEMAVATGIPGLALYLVAAGFLVIRSVKAVRTQTPVAIGIAAGVTGYLAQQFFLFPLAEIDPVFWLFTGVLVAATGSLGIDWHPPRAASWVWIAIAAFIGIAGAADVVADRRAAAAVVALNQDDASAALGHADGAVALRPDSIRYHLLAARAADDGTALGYSRAADSINAALVVSPLDPILRAERADLLLRSAQSARDTTLLGAATTAWEELVDYDPVHARYRLELGNAYVFAGRLDDAVAQWNESARLAPSSTAPLINLAIIYIETGRTDAAVAAIEAIERLDPSAPQIGPLRAQLGNPSDP